MKARYLLCVGLLLVSGPALAQNEDNGLGSPRRSAGENEGGISVPAPLRAENQPYPPGKQRGMRRHRRMHRNAANRSRDIH